MSRTRKLTWAAALALVAIFALLLVTGFVFCQATLHVTRRTGPQPAGATLATIAAQDGARLDAWWFPSASSHGRCVIVLHGIGDSRASSSGFAPLFLDQGYSVLAPDSRGHGTSGGAFVTYGLLEKFDVIGWARWMRARGCQRIYGLGESLGASVLIQAAAVAPVFRAIVAESPYADLRAMGVYRAEGMLGGPRFIAGVVANAAVASGMLYARVRYNLDLWQVSPLRAIQDTATPVLLIHGLNDQRTPPGQSRLLAAMHPERDRLWLVPGGGHTDASSLAPNKFRSLVTAWFGER